MWRWDSDSLSWGERGRGYRMKRVAAVFVEEGCRSGRCSVRVGCCVSLLFVVIECRKWIVRVCGGVNDGVSIEYSV